MSDFIEFARCDFTRLAQKKPRKLSLRILKSSERCSLLCLNQMKTSRHVRLVSVFKGKRGPFIHGSTVHSVLLFSLNCVLGRRKCFINFQQWFEKREKRVGKERIKSGSSARHHLISDRKFYVKLKQFYGISSGQIHRWLLSTYEFYYLMDYNREWITE